MKPIDKYSEEEFAQLVGQSLGLSEAPTHLVHAAVALWQTASPREPSYLVQAAKQLVEAVLSFDSWAQSPLASGMRGSSTTTRHLLFDAKGRDIDLRIEPDMDGFSLNGQILGPDETGAIELIRQSTSDDTKVSVTTELDPFGEFRVDNVPSGIYMLTLRVAGEEIVLPPIEVGERS